MAQQGLESGQQPTSALKYMTVPEKIELTTGGENVYQRQTGIGRGESAVGEAASRYRSMRVPDKITLGGSGSHVAEPGEPSEAHTRREAEPTWSRTGAVPVEPMRARAEEQGGSMLYANIHQHEPVAAGMVLQEPPLPANVSVFERRVKSLEQRVDRLTDIVIHRDSGGSPRQGNGFWYVMTFAGWMMVPLIVAFMYYRKAL